MSDPQNRSFSRITRLAIWLSAIGLWLAIVATVGMVWRPRGPWPAAHPVVAGQETLRPEAAGAAAVASDAPDEHVETRRAMVQIQLRDRGIYDPRVLSALERVPRHRFVPEQLEAEAYRDAPLPIGNGQTISQPYIVALMTQLAAPGPNARALEIGTGSGYQAAVLAELCAEVYSVEIVEPLAEQSAAVLDELGYKNVHLRQGDGYRGWPDAGPYDVILVTAAPDHIPQPLVDQLAVGGRMVLPVGRFGQRLIVIEKQPNGEITRNVVAPVAFVRMTGEGDPRAGLH